MSARVCIVTPVLNGARFIREAIESVLSQNGDSLDYIVSDGGSIDGTLDIVREYVPHLRLIEWPERGQAAAIRDALATTTSEFVGYLNGDDTLLPGAISTLVQALDGDATAAVAYGAALHVDEFGRTLSHYPTRPFDADALMRECYICQPATLIRRSAYDAVGGIDPSLSFALDYDLWLRLAAVYPMRFVEGVIATSRMYAGNKTLSDRGAVYREICLVLSRRRGYVPYEWVAGYATFLLDRRDQFLTPARRSPANAVLALPLGLWINRAETLRYAADWWAHRSLARRR